MALGSGVLPAWVILMPFDEWDAGEISDQEMWEWLTNPNNCVPEEVIDNWKPVLFDKEDNGSQD